MFQESEVVNLILGVVSVFVFFALARNNGLPRYPSIYRGFFCIIAAYFLTVVEGVLWHDVFNVLEHLSYAAAAYFFLSGVRALSRQQAPSGEGT